MNFYFLLSQLILISKCLVAYVLPLLCHKTCLNLMQGLGNVSLLGILQEYKDIISFMILKLIPFSSLEMSFSRVYFSIQTKK